MRVLKEISGQGQEPENVETGCCFVEAVVVWANMKGRQVSGHVSRVQSSENSIFEDKTAQREVGQWVEVL